jgi:hypothetical protein
VLLQAKLDEWGKLAWLSLLVLAFMTGWPFGLVVLAYLAGSGRLKAWRAEMPGTWFNLRGTQPGRAWYGRTASSGNQAFDAYREETLSRLEEEQQEFQAFLERLRQARDKAEFDQFMAERRRRTGVTEPRSDA